MPPFPPSGQQQDSTTTPWASGEDEKPHALPALVNNRRRARWPLLACSRSESFIQRLTILSSGLVLSRYPSSAKVLAGWFSATVACYESTPSICLDLEFLVDQRLGGLASPDSRVCR